jgi:hypothetical protein
LTTSKFESEPKIVAVCALALTVKSARTSRAVENALAKSCRLFAERVWGILCRFILIVSF